MKLLFNNSNYNVESIDDALDVINEYCTEFDMFHDDPSDDGDITIDIFDIYVDDEGTPFKIYQNQAVIIDK